MGGNAFDHRDPPITTPRMSQEIYATVKHRCFIILQEHFFKIDSPIEGPEKESYGDIDIVVALPKWPVVTDREGAKGEILQRIGEALRATAMEAWKGPEEFAASYAIPWPHGLPYPEEYRGLEEVREADVVSAGPSTAAESSAIASSAVAGSSTTKSSAVTGSSAIDRSSPVSRSPSFTRPVDAWRVASPERLVNDLNSIQDGDSASNHSSSVTRRRSTITSPSIDIWPTGACRSSSTPRSAFRDPVLDDPVTVDFSSPARISTPITPSHSAVYYWPTATSEPSTASEPAFRERDPVLAGPVTVDFSSPSDRRTRTTAGPSAVDTRPPTASRSSSTSRSSFKKRNSVYPEPVTVDFSSPASRGTSSTRSSVDIRPAAPTSSTAAEPTVNDWESVVKNSPVDWSPLVGRESPFASGPSINTQPPATPERLIQTEPIVNNWDAVDDESSPRYWSRHATSGSSNVPESSVNICPTASGSASQAAYSQPSYHEAFEPTEHVARAVEFTRIDNRSFVRNTRTARSSERRNEHARQVVVRPRSVPPTSGRGSDSDSSSSQRRPRTHSSGRSRSFSMGGRSQGKGKASQGNVSVNSHLRVTKAHSGNSRNPSPQSDAPSRLHIQVDVRFCSTMSKFSYQVFHHAHGDLWSILGGIIRPYGLTIDDEGLHVRIPEIETVNKKQSKILLTSTPGSILMFLDLPLAKYWSGPFDTINEMFEYISACRLFWVDPASNTEGERRALRSNDRRRLAKRPAFRKFVEEYMPRCREEGRFAVQPYTRETTTDLALRWFGAGERYREALRVHLVKEQGKRVYAEVIRRTDPAPLTVSSNGVLFRSCLHKALKSIIIEGQTRFGVAAPSSLRDRDGFLVIERVREFIARHREFVGRQAIRENQRELEAHMDARPSRRS